MVAGHLREKRGYYHIILNYQDEQGNKKQKSISTGLPVKDNKKRAESLLLEARMNFEVKSNQEKEYDDILFTDFMLDWVQIIKNNIAPSTYAAYICNIKKAIIPYFEPLNIKLKELTPKHIQDFYTHELEVKGNTPNTVIRKHANIRKALQYAFKTGLVDSNPADRIERPKKNKFVSDTYNQQELEYLFSIVKGEKIELPVILGAFYGLRRSEVLGLKWSAIDFENKKITISHTVTVSSLEGKQVVSANDRTKTKSSYRTLPLIEPIEKLLIEMKEHQEENKRLFGNCYVQEYLEYVCVDDNGERLKPNYVTQHFQILLHKNGLKKIRFHDLRHPYVKLGLKNILFHTMTKADVAITHRPLSWHDCSCTFNKAL